MINSMKHLSPKHYIQIARAIDYLTQHAQEQPSLDTIASACNMSTSSLQRLFSDYVGVSPKQFLMYMSTEHAKQLLQDGPSLLETSSKTGLSSTGRLHDHFVHIEAMTPGEYKSGGKDLEISYNFYNSPYGELIIASTARGICYTSGDVATYGEIAQHIDHDKAHRAVGTAVGHNPISYIIPCHRVIQSSGIIGNYMWGPQRKKLILTQEFSHK